MKFNFQNKKAIINFILLMFSISIFFYLLAKLPIRINLTSSVKQGIYLIKKPEEIKKGDYIALCLSENLSNEIYKRGYLKKGHACHDKYESLLKKVVATPNDQMTIEKDFILINNHKINLQIQKTDRNNQPIPKNKYEKKFKLKGYWVIGDNSQNSFDSRYFGEISKKQIVYKAKPWILF